LKFTGFRFLLANYKKIRECTTREFSVLCQNCFEQGLKSLNYGLD